ncbi:unnamed protein product [Brassica oleracea]|uniref:(rape) hypothetical protein n=1 Tax=Brassica napus TaxID=3708 RepID=A0A816KUY4_BRANA|nr:unnamed protein product [Brassica napus]
MLSFHKLEIIQQLLLSLTIIIIIKVGLSLLTKLGSWRRRRRRREASRSNVPCGLWTNVARLGAGGFDFPGGMSFVSILGGNNNQMPGLELGFAQEGNVGVFNQHSFTQIYQQMTQAQGRVLHHTLHHNPSHEGHHQQESDEKDDSQGSGL